MTMDFHSPWILDERIFFYRSALQARMTRYAEILSEQNTKLPYKSYRDKVDKELPARGGKDDRNRNWSLLNLDTKASGTIEIGYTAINKVPVTKENLREFGKAMAESIVIWLQEN